MKQKNVIGLLLGIILLGAVFRFYHLGATSFVSDEFLDINSSYAYAKTGHWQAWDFNFGREDSENFNPARDQRAAAYKWQVAGLFKLGFPPTEGVARSISALWGIVSIVLVYLTASYFTKKKEIGLLAAFLFAISISGIFFDRKLRMYAMFLPIFLSFSWMLFRFFEEKYNGKIRLARFFWEKLGVNVLYLIPAVLLGALSLSVHQLTANIIIVLFFYALIQVLRKKGGKAIFLNKYYLILSAILASFLVARIFFPVQLETYTSGLEFFGSHFGYLSRTFSDYSQALLAVLFLAVGIYYLYKKEKLEEETLWLAVSFFAVLLSAMFLWDRNVGDQYIFFIKSFEIILIASGIYALAEFLGKNLEKYKSKAFYVPLALSLLLLPNYGYFFQDSNTYKQTSESDSANYKKIFTYVNKKVKPSDVFITRNFRNYYWSGKNIKVYDFGGELAEEKLSLDEVKNIQSENPSGWLIISDNDDAYIANDAMEYIVKNFERVSNDQVRGKVLVYKWGNNTN